MRSSYVMVLLIVASIVGLVFLSSPNSNATGAEAVTTSLQFSGGKIEGLRGLSNGRTSGRPAATRLKYCRGGQNGPPAGYIPVRVENSVQTCGCQKWTNYTGRRKCARFNDRVTAVAVGEKRSFTACEGVSFPVPAGFYVYRRSDAPNGKCGCSHANNYSGRMRCVRYFQQSYYRKP